jgi:menaquinone-dependent protoporphyrinogen oxidase
MSGTILVAYATKHGSTAEVAEEVCRTLRARGAHVDLRPASDVNDLRPYAGVVVGGCLYMGRWHRDARRLLRRRHESLAALPVAVFAMGPQTLEAKPVAMARKQLDKALTKVPSVRPVSVAIFGGVVDPAKLRFPFNRMKAGDARDWEAIRAWAAEVAALLVTQQPAPVA